MARRPQQRNLVSVAEFQRQLGALRGLIATRQRDVYRAFAFAVFESLQVGSAGANGGPNPFTGSPGTPVDTGFARNSWWVSTTAGGGPAGSPDQRSINDGGALALGASQATLLSADIRLPMYYFNNAAYIIPLEFGWSAQAPRGFVRLTTTGAQPLLNAIVRKLIAA